MTDAGFVHTYSVSHNTSPTRTTPSSRASIGCRTWACRLLAHVLPGRHWNTKTCVQRTSACIERSSRFINSIWTRSRRRTDINRLRNLLERTVDNDANNDTPTRLFPHLLVIMTSSTQTHSTRDQPLVRLGHRAEEQRRKLVA